MEPYDFLTVKNALVMPMFYVRGYIMFSVVNQIMLASGDLAWQLRGVMSSHSEEN